MKDTPELLQLKFPAKECKRCKQTTHDDERDLLPETREKLWWPRVKEDGVKGSQRYRCIDTARRHYARGTTLDEINEKCEIDAKE